MQIVDFQLPIVNAQHGQAAANPLFATESTALFRHGFTRIRTVKKQISANL
jgi:hypothetical protein